MKMKISEALENYYSDILSHKFEPNGNRVVVGTTMSKLVVLLRNPKTNSVSKDLDTKIADKNPVLSLHWGTAGIFVGSTSRLYLYTEGPTGFIKSDKSDPSASYDCSYDIHAIGISPLSPRTFIVACDDTKSRVFDIETQKVLTEFTDHKESVDVLSTNSEYVATGGQDGKVFLYDGAFRTNKPVVSFDQNTGNGKCPISALSLSPSGTWVAIGCAYANSPVVYNMRNAISIPSISLDIPKPSRLTAVHFNQYQNLIWTAGKGMIYMSETMKNLDAQLKTQYGNLEINQVYSIISHEKQMSVAGTSNAVLFSDNGFYWDTVISDF